MIISRWILHIQFLIIKKKFLIMAYTQHLPFFYLHNDRGGWYPKMEKNSSEIYKKNLSMFPKITCWKPGIIPKKVANKNS